MSKHYNRHFLGYELAISVVITVGLFLAIKYTGHLHELIKVIDPIRPALYGTIATVAGALLGFVITGISVLLTTGQNEGMRALRSSATYPQIFKVFFSSSRYMGILVVTAMAGIFSGQTWILYMNLWAVLIVVFRILRCIWVLESIVNISVTSK